jgi:hypothetical protein
VDATTSTPAGKALLAETASDAGAEVGDEPDTDTTPFKARVVEASLAGDAEAGSVSVEIENLHSSDAEVLIEFFALDETQSVRASVSVGSIAAGATASFDLPISSFGLRAAELRVGGALKLLPTLRLADGMMVPRAGGPLTLGYHFVGARVHAYDVERRTAAYAAGRLDSVPAVKPEVLSPARVTKVSDTVGASRSLDGEPDTARTVLGEVP